MPRVRSPKTISEIRNLKGAVGKMLKTFKKISLTKRKDMSPIIAKAEAMISKKLAQRIKSLSNAISKSKTDKASKYLKEIVSTLDKKYTKLSAKVEKMRLALEAKLAKKSSKKVKKTKASTDESSTKKKSAKKDAAAPAKKKATKKAAKKDAPKKKATKKAPAKKAPAKKTTTRKSKKAAVPAAYQLFGGFYNNQSGYENENMHEMFSDLEF